MSWTEEGGKWAGHEIVCPEKEQFSVIPAGGCQTRIGMATHEESIEWKRQATSFHGTYTNMYLVFILLIMHTD